MITLPDELPSEHVAVHLANRMEQMADADTILITGETYAAAKQFVEVVPLGMQAVRGISTPVETFSAMHAFERSIVANNSAATALTRKALTDAAPGRAAPRWSR